MAEPLDASRPEAQGDLTMSSGGSLAVRSGAPSLVRSRWADYVELTRPRLSVRVLFAGAAGACLAGAGSASLTRPLHAVVGAALVVAGGSGMNPVLERDRPARMVRTRSWPMWPGRLRPE